MGGENKDTNINWLSLNMPENDKDNPEKMDVRYSEK